MSMTRADAQDVMAVLRSLPHLDTGAAEACERLRGRAAQVLGGGMSAEDLAAAWPRPAVDGLAQCRVCGCTEDRPCEGGCVWVPDLQLLGDLCSSCSEGSLGVSERELVGRLLLEVAAECARHAERWGEGDRQDGTGLTGDLWAARHALAMAEETAEAGTTTWRHLLRLSFACAVAETSPSPLRAHLLELAAVAVRWAQAIEGRVMDRPIRLDDVAAPGVPPS